ncbi:uncharacterized protein LOC122293191 isoform X2 [Carya illinoinensis]|uniref:uncharacterized protein LOC122293191 isoform X2 n=1 Tax=Carya illinoinensis TaxID=32201 RepID=UPI001C727339|nr:uncharacterized protein LOC122293191 isoform X2 [Carya illinoinensis]
METKSTVFSAAVPVPELLDKHNYEKWAILVRTYLEGQDLWEDIIDDNENATAAPSQNENDDGDAIKVRRRRNFMALHVIQTSCGPDAFSKISTIRSADTAWQTLKRKYLPADTGDIDNSYLQYADLYRAVLEGNLIAAKDFFVSQPEAVRKAITYKGETALHIAVTAGRDAIVEELARRMSVEDLEIEDGDGYTALMKALVYGRSKLVSHLYPSISWNHDLVLAEKVRKVANLLTRAIYTTNLDLALDLIKKYPSLTLALDDRGESPFLALASVRPAFRSGKRLVCWKKWIYFGMHIDQPAPSTSSEIRLSIPNIENGRQCNQVVTIELVPAKSIISNLLGIKQLYDMKKIHTQSKVLLSCMCKEIQASLIHTGGQLENIGGVYDAINRAVRNGIPEFVYAAVELDPRFLENKYNNSRNLLMLAVLYRHYKIFRHIWNLDMKNISASYVDRSDNNLLHMTGMTEDSTIFNQISGAALQMQGELQWFKGVERIINPKIKEATNKDGLTPRELFTKNHKNMMEKGEKWMKDTSSSCTVVGALIITITFAVAFTLPGGNDQTSGFPIFSKKTLFKVFIISDTLSLFSSSTLVLMFLGILTSRYAEEDFIVSLPRKMIIGLSTLFFSIAAMMVAFSVTLLIILNEQLLTAITLICLAGVPVTFFIWIQFPILKDMIKLTCFSPNFNRKMKLDFN